VTDVASKSSPRTWTVTPDSDVNESMSSGFSSRCTTPPYTMAVAAFLRASRA
jgi:hypothetical protein